MVNISKIRPIVTSIALTAGLITGTFYVCKKSADIGTANKKAMSEIKSKDFERYVECLENCANGKTVRWCDEAAKMNDSLRIDSMAKAAYAKGIQAAKDSLKAVR